MRKIHWLIVCLLLLLLTSCTQVLNNRDVSNFIKEHDIKPTRTILVNDKHYIFVEDTENLSIYVLKSKNNSSVNYSVTKDQFKDEPIFLGGSETGSIGMVITKPSLLEKADHFVITLRNGESFSYKIDQDKKEYVITNKKLSTLFDYEIAFYDIQNKLLYRLDNPSKLFHKEQNS